MLPRKEESLERLKLSCEGRRRRERKKCWVARTNCLRSTLPGGVDDQNTSSSLIHNSPFSTSLNFSCINFYAESTVEVMDEPLRIG